MTRAETRRLDTGDSFPELRVSTTTGRTLILPEEFKEEWSLILFYRGDW